MSKKIFYRIEREKDGGGPYGSFSSLDRCFHPTKHPAPTNDAKLMAAVGEIQPKHLFAFRSPRQLRAWCNKKSILSELQKEGYVIRVIEAEGAYGSSQAVFDKYTRRDIMTIKMTEI